MPKEAFLADDPLELPGCLPYVAMRARTALQGLGYLEGEQHIPENVLISQLRNWQGELPCSHAELLQHIHCITANTILLCSGGMLVSLSYAHAYF